MYLVNPLGCQNCKSVDHAFLNQLLNNKKFEKRNLIFIMPSAREVEIPVLLKTFLGENWEAYRPNVFFSDELTKEIVTANHLDGESSSLLIYSPAGKVLFDSYIYSIETDSLQKKYF